MVINYRYRWKENCKKPCHMLWSSHHMVLIGLRHLQLHSFWRNTYAVSNRDTMNTYTSNGEYIYIAWGFITLKSMVVYVPVCRWNMCSCMLSVIIYSSMWSTSNCNCVRMNNYICMWRVSICIWMWRMSTCNCIWRVSMCVWWIT